MLRFPQGTRRSRTRARCQSAPRIKLRTVGTRFSLKTACKKLCALLRSMFLELSSQSASSTVSAARCPAVCQGMTSHVLTTSQLQSSSYASCRHQSSCHDQRRRHLARQGPVCNVAITMSASSIGLRSGRPAVRPPHHGSSTSVRDLSARQHHYHTMSRSRRARDRSYLRRRGTV